MPGQTLATPLVTTTLYFLVFGWSLGHQLHDIDGVPYARFIVPGLVVMGTIQNAYLNSASSLFVMKLQGTIVDLLVSPLSYAEVLAGFVGAAVLRGLLVGGVTWVVAGLFTGFQVDSPLATLGMLTLVAIIFAGLGVMTAIWAASFEQVNFIPTFFILPLTFLGGVFAPVKALPAALAPLTRLNPVFYLVDAVRHAMLGVSEVPAGLGTGLVLALAAAALAGPWAMLKSGWRLRS